MGTRGRAERVGWAGGGVHPQLKALWRQVGVGQVPPLDPRSALIRSLSPSCVCKEDQVGDGRSCYGHLLHEVQRASVSPTRVLGLRTAIAMLGVWPRP